MSYGICRCSKVTSASSGSGAYIHNEREKTHSNSNPDIDFGKSNLNYHLGHYDDRMNYNQRVDERIKQGYTGKRAIRKDAVRMVEFLFATSSEDSLTPEGHKEYLESSYDWLCERFGKENVIADIVHLDEKTPHMHAIVVPLTTDGRLSCKDVIGGPKQLQAMQDDFFEKVSSKFGLERGEKADLDDSEREIKKHKPQKEFKEYTLAQIDKKIDEHKKDLKDQQTEIRINSIQISSIRKNLNELTEQENEKTEQLESVNKDLEQVKSNFREVWEQSKTIKNENFMASVSLRKAREELSELSDEVEDKKTELEEIRGDVDHLLTVKRELNEDIEQIKDEKEQLQRDVQELNHDIYNLEAKKDSIESEITETQSKLDKLKGMLGDFERTLQTRVKGFVRGVFDSFQKVKEFVFETSDGDPDILGTSAESIQFIEEEAEKSADAKFDEVIADPVKESISEEADKVENEIEAEYPVYKSVRRR